MPTWLPQQWGASSCWGEAYQFIMSRTNLSSAFKTLNSAKYGSHQYEAHWFPTHCQPASQIPNDKNRFLRLTKKDDAGSDDRCVGVHLGGDGARLRTVSRARQLDRGRFILRPIYSDPVIDFRQQFTIEFFHMYTRGWFFACTHVCPSWFQTHFHPQVEKTYKTARSKNCQQQTNRVCNFD